MNIHLDNVNLASSSGPNSFAGKLIRYSVKNKVRFDKDMNPDAYLCFIETLKKSFDAPMFQRLDGIYFNKSTDYNVQNSNIKRTYDMATGVVFQSEFNRDLITKYFGEHPMSTVIHNGADIEEIERIDSVDHEILNGHENVWACASHWRPHKRLSENIRYFLENSGDKDCLVVAGKTDYGDAHPRVFFAGDLPQKALIALYKRSKYCLHLAWLDHCPNVVVDARASGCKVVCSSAGGTKEIAGPDAIVIEEEPWDFEPVYLYQPPKLDFNKVVDNPYNSDYNMIEVAKKYENFMRDNI